MAALAGKGHAAAVCFDDGFGDGQTHAGALYQIALILTTIEFFEDEALLEVVNAGAAVGDAGGDEIAGEFRGDGDGLADGALGWTAVVWVEGGGSAVESKALTAGDTEGSQRKLLVDGNDA